MSIAGLMKSEGKLSYILTIKNMIAAAVIKYDDLVTVSSTNSGCNSIYSCHDRSS